MIIKIEACYAGNHNYYHRCTLPNGDRVNVGYNTDAEQWDRLKAKELRDYICNNYDVKRNSIKVEEV